MFNGALNRVRRGDFLLTLIVSFIFIAGCTRVDYTKIKDERFVTPDRAPSKYIRSLLSVARAPVVPDSFREAFELVQGWSDNKVVIAGKEQTYSWMRPRERFDSMPMARLLNDADSEKVVQILGDMGFLKASPIPEGVGHIILAGSTLTKMRELLKFVNAYVMTHPNVHVWILAGERPLSASAGETQEKLHDPNNGVIAFRPNYVRSLRDKIVDERKMAKLIVDQSFIGSNSQITVVVARKSSGAPRATTIDTINAFLAKNPPSGKYVFVSSPPFLERQTIQIKHLLRKGARKDIALVGAGPDPKIREAYNRYSPSHVAAIGLDELARVMYTLMQKS